MSRRRATPSYNGVTYQKVAANDDDFIDAQFEIPKQHIPWKALTLATLLCVAGTTLLVVGSLLVSGHIDVKYADRTWPLIILGAIMFLPGAYHIRIAYYAYRQFPGYSFSDIPEFD